MTLIRRKYVDKCMYKYHTIFTVHKQVNIWECILVRGTLEVEMYTKGNHDPNSSVSPKIQTLPQIKSRILCIFLWFCGFLIFFVFL